MATSGNRALWGYKYGSKMTLSAILSLFSPLRGDRDTFMGLPDRKQGIAWENQICFISFPYDSLNDENQTKQTKTDFLG